MKNEKDYAAVEKKNEDKPTKAGGEASLVCVLGAILLLASLYGMAIGNSTGCAVTSRDHQVSIGEEVAVTGTLPPRVDMLGGDGFSGHCWLKEGGKVSVLKVDGDYVLVKYQAPSVQPQDYVWTPCPDGTLAVMDRSRFIYLRNEAAAEPARRRAAEEKARAGQKFFDEMNNK